MASIRQCLHNFLETVFTYSLSIETSFGTVNEKYQIQLANESRFIWKTLLPITKFLEVMVNSAFTCRYSGKSLFNISSCFSCFLSRFGFVQKM